MLHVVTKHVAISVGIDPKITDRTSGVHSKQHFKCEILKYKFEDSVDEIQTTILQPKIQGDANVYLIPNDYKVLKLKLLV